jgi:predicted ATP-dependent endonuclease of OLD family
LRIKHIGIKNFRGVKSPSWPVKGDFNCMIGPGDTCNTTILKASGRGAFPRLQFQDRLFTAPTTGAICPIAFDKTHG